MPIRAKTMLPQKPLERCLGCYLHKRLCLCAEFPQLADVPVKFWLMFHPSEVYKPTNTGRLIQRCFPQTRVFTFNRVHPEAGLLAACKETSGYLLFPADETEFGDRLCTLPVAEGEPTFVIFDGTWKQARKMFRKSSFFGDWPIARLNPSVMSRYALRRRKYGHHLCTFETAAEALQQQGLEQPAEEMRAFFTRYISAYLSMRPRVAGKLGVTTHPKSNLDNPPTQPLSESRAHTAIPNR